MKKEINIRFMLLLFITVILGIWRVMSEQYDFSALGSISPLGAMALFGGAYFSKKYSAYLFPLVVLFVSDVILMQTIYAEYRSGILYDGWYWTYGSFALMVTVGERIKHKVSVKNVALACITAGLVHFTISNFGVWLGGGTNLLTGLPYTRDVYGLLNCYLAAIPYFKSLLIGNLFFSVVLFGGFEIAESKFKLLQTETNH